GGQDTREFQLSVDIDQEGRPKNEDLQVAVVELSALMAGATDPQMCGRASPIVVHWTDDLSRSSRIDRVQHFDRQGEIDRAILAGCDAYDAARLSEAEQEWGL